MIRFLILITLFVLIQSCSNNNDVTTRLNQLYKDSEVGIDSLEIYTLYLRETKLTKLKNLFLINSLYYKTDSLLRLDYEENKIDENLIALEQNEQERIQTIRDIDEEIQSNSVETVGSLKYYILWYKKNDSNKRYSIIWDKNYNLIFVQDPQINPI